MLRQNTKRRRASPGVGGHRAQSGFSIHDLIITSTVVTVLSLGAAGMSGMVQDARLTAATNLLMGDMNLARNAAIKHRSRIAVCQSHDGASCSGLSWSNGWIIFSDQNENYKIDGDESLILVRQGVEGNMSLRYGGEKMSYARMAYYPEGYARPNATFTLCDRRGAAKAKSVIINTAGRAYTSTKTWENKPLECS